MNKPYITASLVASWQLYDETDWFGDKKMREALTRSGEPNKRMDIGTAVHAILAKKGKEYRDDDVYVVNGIRINARDILQFDMPDVGVTEAKGSRVLQCSVGPVDIVARADVIYGNAVWDWKVSTKDPDMERHVDSGQALATFYVFECDEFEFRYVRAKKERDSEKREVYRVAHESTLPLNRPPDVEHTLRGYCEGIIEFAYQTNLQRFLEYGWWEDKDR